MSNVEPLDISRFPPHFRRQDGVLIVGDLHAHPLKAIQLLIHTQNITGLNAQHYDSLYQIYSESYRLAEIYYNLEREHVTAVKEFERSMPRLAVLRTAYAQHKLVDGHPVTEVKLQAAQTILKQAEDKLALITPPFMGAKAAFLEHLRLGLPMFMDILSKMKPGNDHSFFRLIGDDIRDRGACCVWVQAALKVATDKKIEWDVLLSNHGVLALVDDPAAAEKLDSGKMQALSGITMALVEREGQDLLDGCGLTHFMQDVYLPRLKLGGYILRDDGGFDIDYHAPVDINDIKAQYDFLGIAAEAPKSHEDFAAILDAISDRVRAYAREGRMHEIIAISDFKHASIEARAFVRKHNPINFAIWNRDASDLVRTNAHGTCWRHGHESIAYKEPHLQCINSDFGKGPQLTQPEGETTQIFSVSQGRPSLNAEPDLTPAPTQDIHRRLLMIVASRFRSGSLDEPYLFELAEKIRGLKDLELKPFLKRDIRERTFNLRAENKSVEKSPHLSLLKEALNAVENFESRCPGLSFLWTLQSRVENDFGHFKRGRGFEKHQKLIQTIERLKLQHPTAQPTELLHSMGTTLFQDLAYTRFSFSSSIANSARRANREFIPSEIKKQALVMLRKEVSRLKMLRNSHDKLLEIQALINKLDEDETVIHNLEELCALKADGHQHNLLSALMMHRNNKPADQETKAHRKLCKFFDLNEILGEEKLEEILQEGNSEVGVAHGL